MVSLLDDFFFFSSRRRHTRYWRDWSSDVCSSDLRLNLDIVNNATRQAGGQIGMLMAWGWNIKYQGVYDDEGNFGADKESMITGVSQLLAAKRERLSLASTTRPDRRSEERRVGKECRSRWSPYH